MAGNITLTVTNGSLKGKSFVLTGSQRCLIGRSHDCDVQVPPDLEFLTVSRHHCLLNVDPPRITMIDLGSRNGTFLNGLRAGAYLSERIPGRAIAAPWAEYELKDGDEVGLGDITLEVHVHEPTKHLETAETPTTENDAQAGSAAPHDEMEHEEEEDNPFAPLPWAEAHEESEGDAAEDSPFAFVGCAHAGR